VLFFIQVFWINFYMHFSFYPCMLHGPPNFSSSTCST
jgi:hypothetical protein